MNRVATQSLFTGHFNFVSVRHKLDEAVYCEGFVVSYRASGVDGITDYNGFSPCRSCEVDRVTGCIYRSYLRLFSYLTVLFILYLF